jgi:hypothetical protein
MVFKGPKKGINHCSADEFIFFSFQKAGQGEGKTGILDSR